MTPDVNVLVLTGFGLNCDHETAHMFELAGASAQRVHINELIADPRQLDTFQIIAFGGGFSWGDDHGAGVVQAVRLKTSLGERLIRFVEAGHLVIGICNGFQTLVNLGLLPGIDKDYRTRSVALTYNDCGNFQDRWVNLNVDSDSPCVFTRGLSELALPVRHGEGKFFADDPTIARLMANKQIVLRYTGPDGNPADQVFPHNPNGSVMDIAGICDPTGRVFGLMPHPEAYHHPANHPRWTREKESAKRAGVPWGQDATAGLKLFENAVRFAAGI
jgi:phosphoribosylformylglycinamidine synthase I